MSGVAQVADAVRLGLAGPATDAHVESDVQVVERSRTTLYFMTLRGAGRSRSLVVKVKRYPHSADDSVEDSPGRRARREYEAMVQVHRHFARLGDMRLGAIEPVGFLPDIDAIVMERLEGDTLYRATMPPRRRLRAAARRHGVGLFRTTGRWLRRLHEIAPDGIAPRRLVGRSEAVTGIREARARLLQMGAPVECAQLEQAVVSLEGDGRETPVWLHSDFHVGNVHVVGEDGIVGVDTALNWRGNPYVDLGKFLADMKTRRVRVMTGGRLPSQDAVQELEDAFLAGYFEIGGAPDWRSLRLFEGWFLLRKWCRTARARTPIDRPIRQLLVHPTYGSCVRRWSDGCKALR